MRLVSALLCYYPEKYGVIQAMNSALRPMSTGEVLDRTFYLYRNNFALFAGITLVASLLTLATRLILLSMFGPAGLQGALASVATYLTVVPLVTILTYLVVHALASGATVHAVSRVHLGQPASIGQAYTAVGSIFGRIFWIVTAVFLLTLLVLIAVFIVLMIVMGIIAAIAAISLGGSRMGSGMAGGFVVGVLVAVITLLVVFGCVLYMLSRYAFAVPACMIEKLSAGAALKRSSFLTRKRTGRVFLVILLTGIIGIALNLVFQIPILGKNIFLAAARSHLSTVYFVWLYLAEFAASVLAGPIATISIALLYYDERIRKEAFDLQLMMQSMEVPAAQVATAAMPGSGAIQ